MSHELASLQRVSAITDSLLTDLLNFPLSIGGNQPLRSEPGRFADLAEWHHYCVSFVECTVDNDFVCTTIRFTRRLMRLFIKQRSCAVVGTLNTRTPGIFERPVAFA
jgi:hypothetical protein